MLMGTHDGGVEHGVFVIGILRQMRENPLPYAAFAPAGMPGRDQAEIAKPRWQIPPWYPRSITVQNRFHKQSVVPRRAANMAFTAGQQILDPFPLIVS